MEKLLCVKSQNYYNMSLVNNPPKEISIVKHQLYYVAGNTMKGETLFYNVYDFNTAEYIGIFSSEYFGPYNLWIALQRDLKIEEILND